MKKQFLYTLLCILTTFFFACVPANKLKDEKAKRETCEKDLANYKASAQGMETQLAELKNKIAEDEKRLIGLQKDTSIIGTNYRHLTSKYDKLNQLNESLLDKYNKLLAGSNSESQKLSGQLSSTQEQLQKKEDDLKKLQGELLRKEDDLKVMKAELDKKKTDLDVITAELKKREDRVKELEDVLRQKEEAVNALKKKVSDALLGFEGKGLTITQKNGKVYVSMDESLLFQSGKWVVEPKGVEVLKKLAKVLETNPDINVMVEGHTDDVPMKGLGDVKDNWDLSTVRATSVVKIITQNSTTDPKRLTAAGRGEFFPIDSSKTKEARAKNRRTEIILTPKLDELLKVLEAN